MVSFVFRHKDAKAVRPARRQKTLYSHVLGCSLILGLLLATAEAATRPPSASGETTAPTSKACTVTTTEVVSVTATVVRVTDKVSSATTDPEATGTEIPAISSTKRIPAWMIRSFPQAKILAAKSEATYDVVTVTADAPTNIVTVCETTTETSAFPTTATESTSQTTTAESTTNDVTTSTEAETATVETTPPSETESTATATSDITTIVPETYTTVASESTTSDSPTTSAEVTENTSSTPIDMTSTPEPTQVPSSTTESTTPSATTDVETSTPTPVARCDGQSRYLSLVIDRSYLFNDAAEACGFFGYSLAKISTFKEISDANNVLQLCGVERAWVKANSANTVDVPKCYAINQVTSYEPEDCDQAMMQVLCAFP